MKVENFVNIIGADFYTGVPDSQLKALCDYLMNAYGIDPRHHIIAANEGNCAAVAAGYHLATGKVPMVYMQNSGEGNIVNPAASLLSDKVYAIPCVFVIGWRGEPGTQDEPQHIFQGEVTLPILEALDIDSRVVGPDTTETELSEAMESFRKKLSDGKSVAFVIRKGALQYGGAAEYSSEGTLCREEVIRHIVEASGEDPVVSTTGKASRELFEIREANRQSHKYDFLTVGSMGHSSSIALGVALHRPNEKIWCIDGDGAALMHMGAMAVIGSIRPRNMIHALINNCAHETVGGMPTAAGSIHMVDIAKACGYTHAVSVGTYEELDGALEEARLGSGLRFIEVRCGLGSRGDLGRPTTAAIDNKTAFMDYLRSL